MFVEADVNAAGFNIHASGSFPKTTSFGNSFRAVGIEHTRCSTIPATRALKNARCITLATIDHLFQIVRSVLATHDSRNLHMQILLANPNNKICGSDKGCSASPRSMSSLTPRRITGNTQPPLPRLEHSPGNMWLSLLLVPKCCLPGLGAGVQFNLERVVRFKKGDVICMSHGSA